MADLVTDPDLIEALVWNLRTWPLELVEWNTTNSHRLDITFNPEQDRFVMIIPRFKASLTKSSPPPLPAEISAATPNRRGSSPPTRGRSFVGTGTPSPWTLVEVTLRWTRGRGSSPTGWPDGLRCYSITCLGLGVLAYTDCH